MIYLDVCPKAWAKKHRIADDGVYECPNCGGSFPTDVPIIAKNFVGLESRRHECGDKYTKLVLRPRGKEAVAKWDFMFKGFS